MSVDGVSDRDKLRPLWLFPRAYVESTMCRVLGRLCLSTDDCAENRRLAKVSDKERGSSMLFHNEQIEPDSFLLLSVIRSHVTRDTGYSSRW